MSRRAARVCQSDTETYDDEQAAWLRAVAAYQKRERLKFLAHTDYLRIAHELGYAPPDGAGSAARA